jgi:hypothetical protein
MALVAQAWNEEVSYFECPGCHAINELGSGLSWDEKEDCTCTTCGVYVTVKEPRP